MRQSTVYLPEYTDKLVESIVEASGSTADLPTLSRSEALRQMLREGGEQFMAGEMDVLDSESGELRVDGQSLREQIPEHDLILHRREKFKEGEAQVRNLRTGFKRRWRNFFVDRFEGGFEPEDLEKFAKNARKDVRILFPRDDDEQKRQELLEWIDQVEDRAVQAARQSDWDPLDPDEIFSHHEGVKRGAEKEHVDLDALLERAQEKMSRQAFDHDAIADSLAKEFSVSDELAEQAVEIAYQLKQGNLERSAAQLEGADTTETDTAEADGGVVDV